MPGHKKGRVVGDILCYISLAFPVMNTMCGWLKVYVCVDPLNCMVCNCLGFELSDEF